MNQLITKTGAVVAAPGAEERSLEPNELARTIAGIAADKKAENVLVLDIRGLSVIADYFVICSGTSDRQVRAIVKDIDEQLGKQGIVAMHVEGLAESHWVLMDYANVIVHVFDPATREYYNLEKLWAEAPRV